MATEEDDVRRVLQQAGEPLWASEITERLNNELGAVVYTVDEIATYLLHMGDVRCLPEGRWELMRA